MLEAMSDDTQHDTPAPSAAATLELELRPDGPITFTLPASLYDSQGLEHPLLRKGQRVALCRCGASQHNPLCDGSHRRIGFRAAGYRLELG